MGLGSKRLHVNAFIFLNALTHNKHNVFAEDADNDLLSFLHSMESQCNMKHTLFILMAEHGPRFQKARQAAQGKLEERMPFMGVWVPPEFKTKYHTALRNLRTNLHMCASQGDD